MKKILCLILFLCFLLPLSSCDGSRESTDSFYLMDTLITVTLYTDSETAKPIFASCRERVRELEALWARTDETSDVGRWNASENGLSDLDSRTVSLIKRAMEISSAVNGTFDITVAPGIFLWETCAEKNRLPTEEELANVKKQIGADQLTVLSDTSVSKPNGVGIDLGGIGKGAAISEVIAYLESTDVCGGVVSFGSNVAVFGEKPNGEDFRIALRDPKDRNGYVGVLTLDGKQILSVSGDYERYYTVQGETYHHILDPKTAMPAKSGLSSVAVLCEDGALADALSTALFVMGREEAMAFYRSGIYDFEAVLIASDGTLTLTDGMHAFFQAT